MRSSYQITIPHEQDAGLDIGLVDENILSLVLPVVRDHLESVLALHLQPLDVLEAAIREVVDPVADEFLDADVDQAGIAVLDRRRHRLAPAGDHLQVVVLSELHAH